jgi:hypothetical protein
MAKEADEVIVTEDRHNRSETTVVRISRRKFLMRPETGWHPSHPVVERSWDVFFAHL